MKAGWPNAGASADVAQLGYDRGATPALTIRVRPVPLIRTLYAGHRWLDSAGADRNIRAQLERAGQALRFWHAGPSLIWAGLEREVATDYYAYPAA